MKNNADEPIDRSVAWLTSWVYFVQGAVSLAGIAFPLLLRERGWSVAEISTFVFIEGLPWTLKLLYGAFSDGVPVGGLRRKPYILAASLCSTASWLAIAFLPPTHFNLYLWAILANLGFAVTDVVTDALIVERSTETTSRIYQSLAWGFRSLGAVGGGLLGGWLAERLPYSWVFAFTGLLPITTLAAGLLVHEERQRVEKGRFQLVRPVLGSLRALFSLPDLRWFCLLLLVVAFSSSFSTPFFFFLKEKLEFTETFLGSLSSLTWIGAIAGCFLYGKLSRRVSLKTSLFWGVIFNVVNVAGSFGVVNPVSAVVLSVLGGILGYLALLPLIASATVLAREKGIEGSLFALVMSIYNLGQLVAVYVGGKLFGIIGLRPLILLSAFVSGTGILFVKRLRTLER